MIFTDCGSLSTALFNGTATQTGTLYGDTTVYTCDEGHYITQGITTLTVACLDTGNWNGTVVTCIPVGKVPNHKTHCTFKSYCFEVIMPWQNLEMICFIF